MAITYNNLYLDLRAELKRAGDEEATQSARELVCAAAGKTREELVRDGSLYASPEVEAAAHELVKRHLAGEPVAYLIGEWEFYGLPLDISPAVLIPRPDTEVLATKLIDAARGAGSCRILDLCAGSGCIACAIANELPAARVVAADISPSALEVCRKNIKDNKLTSRIIPMNADATTWPPMSIGSFDVIVSNPPYIPSFELIELDCSVRDYEPMTALDGGEDGLDFYRAIIKYWTITMRPNGFMMFEVGEGQADEVKMMLLKAGFVSVEGRNDTLGFERVVIGKWKNEF